MEKNQSGESKIINAVQARPKTEFKKSAEIVVAEHPSPIEYEERIEPPFYGTGAVLHWDAASLLEKIDTFRLLQEFWGKGNIDKEAYEQAAKERYLPAFERLSAEILRNSLIDPAGYYGFFPVFTDDKEIVLLDPSDFHSELGSVVFPRMPKFGNRSAADYLRPEGDILALQIVTVGRGISERVREYCAKEKNGELGGILNGIGACLTQSLADSITEEIVRALGFAARRGKRYSCGSPATPTLEVQKKLFEIMAIEERLGISLTEGYEIVPEHSALGIYIHHPQAEDLM